MVDDDRQDTVIVEKDHERNPLGWIIAIVIIILLILAFFYYGGFGLFGGSTNNGGSGGSVNVNTPGTTQPQPSTGTGK